MESLNSASFSLKDKVIIVTGGTGVLGYAMIKGIVANGGTVGILGRKKHIAEERAHEIIAAGGKAIPLVADVMNEGQLESVKKEVLDAYGRIDGLLNAAGGNLPEGILMPDDDIFEMNIDGMRKAMELNVWGTVIPTKIFGKQMAEQGGGSIVNISSVNSKKAVTRVMGYNMGKASIDYYTEWFAVELAKRFGDKIRINAIAPGFYLAEQNRAFLVQPDGHLTNRGQQVIHSTPFHRFGNPNELQGAAVWLLSDASKFVTGIRICVDGGFSINSGV